MSKKMRVRPELVSDIFTSVRPLFVMIHRAIPWIVYVSVGIFVSEEHNEKERRISLLSKNVCRFRSSQSLDGVIITAFFP